MWRDQRGLTLTEVLVAAVILWIVAAGLFAAYDVNKRLAAGARQKVKAVNLAQGRLEELQGVPYDELIGVTEWTYFDLSDPAIADFTYRIAVNEGSIVGTVYKTVTVTVCYPVGGGFRQIDLTMGRSKI
ncbi:MAG: prepilin-type N-terminal cleavage/methylation domain-containing protein [Bacillota bacterium]|nr:prepilin-type N-terminal cleavage/methylation domain-containing protein [Thermoanaerobacteraceae bacterium]